MSDIWGTVRQGIEGEGVLCEDEGEADRAITGGCAFVDVNTGNSLTLHDLVVDRRSWGCARRALNDPIDLVLRCVRPLDRSDEIQDGCVCPEYETPVDRLTYFDQVVALPAQSAGHVSATCPAGSTLLGGGCIGGQLATIGEAHLVSAGILPDDPQTWQCTWHVPDIRAASGGGTAICLNAPGPDAVTGAPVAPEEIEHVFVEQTLPASNSRIVEATCAPGDVLIAGGCHVEDFQIEFASLRLMRSTLLPPQDNRPNTWQCAWNNPTSATPKVVAAATCMKPAAPR